MELGAVPELLTSAQAGPACLLLEGEPGIGKTTVWSAALEFARENGFRVLSTRPAAAESVLAYASLADLLSGVDAALWADLPEPQRLAVDRVLLRAKPGRVATDPRAVAAGVLSVVALLAAESPILLALDDMQWLDSSSAAALTFVVRRLTGSVAVLGTTRVETTGAQTGTAVDLSGLRQLRRVRLCPLDLDGIRAAVSQELSLSFARPAMVRIHQVSGGNPFYALELARAVAEAPGWAELALPAPLSELVRARVEGLEADVHYALLAAASASSPTVELVARAIDSSAERVAALLESPAVRGIVSIHGAALRFAHPLLAWGVFTDADPAARRTMHRRLSDIVEEPELRARHLALAATGPDDETVQALDAAAELARFRGAPAAAAELLELAISLGADTSERRILLARSQFTAGDSAASRRHLEAVSSRPVSGALRAEALTLLAVLSLTDGSWTAGAELLGRALGEAAPNLELRARILVPLALAEVNGERFDVAAGTIAAAVSDATELGDAQLLSQALSMYVIVDFLRGNGLDDESLGRAVALEEHDAPVWVQLRATVHQAAVLAWTGQLDAAHDRFLTIRQDLVERGLESDLMFVAFLSVLTEIWRADFATARVVTDDAVERALQLDGVLPLGVALMLAATVDAYVGRDNEARRRVAEATEGIRQSGSRYLMTWLEAASGFLEVSLGNYEAALRILEPALARVTATPRGTEIFVAGFLPDAVEAMIHVGRLDDAEAMVDLLDANGGRLDRAWMLAVGGRCRAMLLAARGDVDAAADAVREALAQHERLPMPFEHARTSLVLGQIQRRQRRKDAAAVTLREALGVFEDLGTPLWAVKARFELTRATAGHRADAELTTSEQRIAELLASGMTRREVASALFISPKTVEANLARIYRKLGIHSRAELGRYVAAPKTWANALYLSCLTPHTMRRAPPWPPCVRHGRGTEGETMAVHVPRAASLTLRRFLLAVALAASAALVGSALEPTTASAKFDDEQYRAPVGQRRGSDTWRTTTSITKATSTGFSCAASRPAEGRVATIRPKRVATNPRPLPPAPSPRRRPRPRTPTFRPDRRRRRRPVQLARPRRPPSRWRRSLLSADREALFVETASRAVIRLDQRPSAQSGRSRISQLASDTGFAGAGAGSTA